jgi:hypothetical protein
MPGRPPLESQVYLIEAKAIFIASIHPLAKANGNE